MLDAEKAVLDLIRKKRAPEEWRGGARRRGRGRLDEDRKRTWRGGRLDEGGRRRYTFRRRRERIPGGPEPVLGDRGSR
ncbi:Protein of unknown function [Gryllus bimaculatus]|nr:Protein of unknown function [Gryllus bimaculatus]